METLLCAALKQNLLVNVKHALGGKRLNSSNFKTSFMILNFQGCGAFQSCSLQRRAKMKPSLGRQKPVSHVLQIQLEPDPAIFAPVSSKSYQRHLPATLQITHKSNENLRSLQIFSLLT